MARVEIAEVRHAPGLRGRAGDHVGVTGRKYLSYFHAATAARAHRTRDGDRVASAVSLDRSV